VQLISEVDQKTLTLTAGISFTTLVKIKRFLGNSENVVKTQIW